MLECSLKKFNVFSPFLRIIYFLTVSMQTCKYSCISDLWLKLTYFWDLWKLLDRIVVSLLSIVLDLLVDLKLKNYSTYFLMDSLIPPSTSTNKLSILWFKPSKETACSYFFLNCNLISLILNLFLFADMVEGLSSKEFPKLSGTSVFLVSFCYFLNPSRSMFLLLVVFKLFSR